MAQLRGCHDGGVGDVYAVVHFVALFQAAQDGNGGLHRGLADQNFLEAALECRVFFDVLAVFVQRGGAHAVQLSARKRGLEHVARVHGALALAGAHHGVQLVNKNNGLAFVLRQVFEHVLQALFKFATELGAGQQRGHIQRQHALALEAVRHLARHNALGQPLDDGGLANARLTDEHGVVFGAALQHLNGAADFVVPADHRVELAQTRALGEVDAVFFERFALVFGVGAVHLLAATHGFDRRLQALAGEAIGTRHLAGVALVVSQRQQEKLAGNELISTLDGLFFGRLQERDHVAPHRDLLMPLHLRQPLDGGFRRSQQAGHIDACAVHQCLGRVVGADHRRQHMRRFDVGVVVGERQSLGLGQGFLKLGGELVDSHRDPRGRVLSAHHLGRSTKHFKCCAAHKKRQGPNS